MGAPANNRTVAVKISPVALRTAFIILAIVAGLWKVVENQKRGLNSPFQTEKLSEQEKIDRINNNPDVVQINFHLRVFALLNSTKLNVKTQSRLKELVPSMKNPELINHLLNKNLEDWFDENKGLSGKNYKMRFRNVLIRLKIYTVKDLLEFYLKGRKNFMDKKISVEGKNSDWDASIHQLVRSIYRWIDEEIYAQAHPDG